MEDIIDIPKADEPLKPSDSPTKKSTAINDQLLPIRFHQDTIYLINHQGEPFVPMRPIMANLGLSWKGQYIKLTSNPKKWKSHHIVAVAEDGKQRDMISIPLINLPAFMLSIAPTKVKPEIRPKLELYQEEFNQVLLDYWTNSYALSPGNITQSPIVAEPITPERPETEKPPKPSDSPTQECPAINNQLLPIKFHEDTIYLIDHNGEPFVPMKPIVENLGLDWSSQHAKLKSNPKRWGMAMFTIPSPGGPQQMVSLPIRKFPAFMLSIEPKKVKPEIRHKLELYQEECDQVLWDYWVSGYTLNPRKIAQSGQDMSYTPITPELVKLAEMAGSGNPYAAAALERYGFYPGYTKQIDKQNLIDELKNKMQEDTTSLRQNIDRLQSQIETSQQEYKETIEALIEGTSLPMTNEQLKLINETMTQASHKRAIEILASTPLNIKLFADARKRHLQTLIRNFFGLKTLKNLDQRDFDETMAIIMFHQMDDNERCSFEGMELKERIGQLEMRRRERIKKGQTADMLIRQKLKGSSNGGKPDQ